MAGAPISPMLASPGPLPVGPGWAFEFKWDGVRALAVVTEGKTRLYARSGVEITIAYPDLAGAGGDLEDALLDGELVVMDEAGRPSFQMLAERMHVRDRARAARLAVTYPVTYLVFDVLRLGRVELFDVPYRERRALLDELALGDRCVVPPAFDDGPATVAASRENQLEGVVAKRLAATYRPGVRSPDWVKVKLDETEEFVVGGWRPGARALGALLVGLPDPGTGALRFVGRVGGGISAASERQLLDTLKPLETATSPFGDTVPRMDARQAVWCRPEVVVELKYGNRTRDGKLRFPRFIRLRPDLSPADLSSSGPRDSSSGPRDA